MASSDLLLSEKITLYNNLVKSGDCGGRLLATFEIDPSPRVVWDFESLGEAACSPEYLDRDTHGLHPFEGESFRIEKPYLTMGGFHGERKRIAGGIAFEAEVGEQDDAPDICSFYLPNCKFQETVGIGQESLLNWMQNNMGEHGLQGWRTPTDGRVLEADLNENWRVHIQTTAKALDWMKAEHRNVGTRLTTTGWIEQVDSSDSSLLHLSLRDARSLLRQLGYLLSFANGGYIAPLYIEQANVPTDNTSALITAFRVTRLETLGQTWLVYDSDLSRYVRCFEAFSKMIVGSPWDEGFETILMWYFQATQRPELGSISNPWPIITNALGASLERLHRWIVIDELHQVDSRSAKPRVKDLLHTIGIATDDDEVDTFFGIRNDATHAEVRVVPNMSREDRNYHIQKAIMWTEEVLLWRLGYDGKYLDRSGEWVSSIEPRYDLSRRDPNW